MIDILKYIDEMQVMYGDKEPSSMDQEPRNMYAQGQLVQPNDDGSRPGYSGKDAATFTSGTGTGKKGIDDPKKYKIVKKYLNQVKSQKNTLVNLAELIMQEKW